MGELFPGELGDGIAVVEVSLTGVTDVRTVRIGGHVVGNDLDFLLTRGAAFVEYRFRVVVNEDVAAEGQFVTADRWNFSDEVAPEGLFFVDREDFAVDDLDFLGIETEISVFYVGDSHINLLFFGLFGLRFANQYP